MKLISVHANAGGIRQRLQDVCGCRGLWCLSVLPRSKLDLRVRTQSAAAAASKVAQAPTSVVTTNRQQQQEEVEISLRHCQHQTTAISSKVRMLSGPQQQQQHLCLAPSQQGGSIPLLSAARSATLPLLLSLLRADSAAAATVCLDVPDWLVDWRALLFHSPVVAVGVAGLALVLFPKLIRVAINYLAIPAILAMLAYAAVSFPETTANSIYTVLEFIRSHPTASSIGIIVAAGALLGPDLLAGSAVAGVLVLLAVKLGILQMPQMPQLPKVPGQALLSRQLNNAGKALQDRLHDLDDGLDDLGDSVRVDRAATQSNFNTGVSSSSNSLLSSGSRESRLLDVQAAPAPPTAAAAAETSPSILSQQQQQQQQQGLAVPGLAGVEGLAQQLGSTARNLGTSAFEQAKAAGSAALQQSKQLKDSGAVQDLTQQTAEVAGKAAQATKQAVGSLWQHGQQVAGAEVLGGLKQGTSAAVERASEAAKGLRVSPPWVGRTSGLGAGEFSSSSGSGIGWTAAAQQQRQAAEQASAMPGDVGGAGINSGKTQQEIDAILANS